jgi:hypothetical protein
MVHSNDDVTGGISELNDLDSLGLQAVAVDFHSRGVTCGRLSRKVRRLGNLLRAAAKGDPASSPGLVTAKLPPELIHAWWREQIDTPVTRAF